MDTTLQDKAAKIPISGPIFTSLNICNPCGSDMLVLNFHTSVHQENDSQYYITVNDAHSLMWELQKAIVIKGSK